MAWSTDKNEQALKDWRIANYERMLAVPTEAAIRAYVGPTDVGIFPNKPTKFWECEYCGTVNPIDLLDCRGKACGHSITKKAMQAAFGAEKPKPVNENIPKWRVSGPGAEDVIIDNTGSIMIGSNDSLAAHMLWDTANNKLTVRGGTTVKMIGL